MLYDYECPEHGEFEVIKKLDEFQPTEPCPVCGLPGKRVLIPGHGCLKVSTVNDVPWLKSSCEFLQDEGERPIETRQEYKKYLKDNDLRHKR